MDKSQTNPTFKKIGKKNAFWTLKKFKIRWKDLWNVFIKSPEISLSVIKSILKGMIINKLIKFTPSIHSHYFQLNIQRKLRVRDTKSYNNNNNYGTLMNIIYYGINMNAIYNPMETVGYGVLE